jgi:hypothetical protein
MRTRFPKVRSRIEKAFIAWYPEHEQEWERPLSLLSRKDGEMTFTLQDLNPNLRIFLHDWKFGAYLNARSYRDALEFGICLDWQGQIWSVLMSFVVVPERTPNGYYDRFTLSDDRKLYSSREALWEAEMFEPLMNWINNRLLPIKRLDLYQRCESDGEVVKTWATPLLEAEPLLEPDPEAIASLLVWLDQSAAKPG